MSWTAADVPDQTGRTTLVTGATSGLGFQAALALARRGGRVVLAGRSPERLADAERRIRAEVTDPALDSVRLDLADLGAVRSAAAEILARHPRLDVLLNNAGVMALPFARTVDGFETQFGTNHLGHFALTGLLLPALLARPGARIVTVSSGAHRMGRLDPHDLGALHDERRYRRWQAYGRSKLANLLFAFELQRRADAAGADLVSAAAHPGWAATNLQAAGPRLRGSRLGGVMARAGNRLFAQPDSMGALPLLYAATMPEVRGGDYYGPDGWMEWRGHPTRVRASEMARRVDLARRLWEESERLTRVHYDLTVPA